MFQKSNPFVLTATHELRSLDEGRPTLREALYHLRRRRRAEQSPFICLYMHNAGLSDRVSLPEFLSLSHPSTPLGTSLARPAGINDPREYAAVFLIHARFSLFFSLSFLSSRRLPRVFFEDYFDMCEGVWF